jgi:hypothetical protein
MNLQLTVDLLQEGALKGAIAEEREIQDSFIFSIRNTCRWIYNNNFRFYDERRSISSFIQVKGTFAEQAAASLQFRQQTLASSANGHLNGNSYLNFLM